MKVLMPDGSEFREPSERTNDVNAKETNGATLSEVALTPAARAHFDKTGELPTAAAALDETTKQPPPRTLSVIALELERAVDDAHSLEWQAASRRADVKRLTDELRSFGRKTRAKKATP